MNFKKRFLAILSITLLVLAALLLAGWLLLVPAPEYDGRASIQSFGGSGAGPGAFHEPTGIVVAGGEVFVADARNARIQVFSMAGVFRRIIGAGILERPMNLAFRGGRLYVPDYFRDSIEVFAPDGAHLASIRAAGGLNSPGGVDVFEDGSVLVADTYNHRVVHLSPQGEVLQSWGQRGIIGREWGEFRYPGDVVIAADGGFYIADTYNYRIQRFDAAGNFLRAWGGAFALGIPGPFPGWFNVISSIDLAADGQSVLAVDLFNQRIQQFTPKGGLLAVYPVKEPARQRSIMGIAAAAPNSVWATNLTHNRIEHWELRGSRD